MKLLFILVLIVLAISALANDMTLVAGAKFDDSGWRAIAVHRDSSTNQSALFRFVVDTNRYEVVLQTCTNANNRWTNIEATPCPDARLIKQLKTELWFWPCP